MFAVAEPVANAVPLAIHNLNRITGTSYLEGYRPDGPSKRREVAIRKLWDRLDSNRAAAKIAKPLRAMAGATAIEGDASLRAKVRWLEMSSGPVLAGGPPGRPGKW